MTSPAERFGALVSALLDEPGVTLSESRGFSRDALMVGGKLFAAVRGEVLLLKLPAERVAALIASGDGAPFDANKGKPMKEWMLARMSADWDALAREAAAFVGR
ncbi:hypothetical protein [Phenylobacterium sp.]|uniref:hypothetical protein n=1 Tax=Phenylobacterium sp. TaxID=1871053 RepID=UPI002CB180C7|nr:hypothetical protein [Phenylobacterium sp.]HLZ76253.1 hypothetical protein [Phenylobacterium sp.]